MKTVIRKAYWDYEKEENWLNEMSAKGLAFIDYTWCRYVFTDSQPGEYIYRMELLDHSISNPGSQKYLRFMEDSGVECIASYMRWVYFRKKASDGVFDIYSDIDSKIKHYKKVNGFWSALACVLMFFGISNVIIGFASQPIHIFNLIAGAVCIILGIGYFILSHPLRVKIRKLKKEKRVTE